jgi:hypothetical protein
MAAASLSVSGDSRKRTRWKAWKTARYEDYAHNVQGMTAEPVPLEAPLATRQRLMRELDNCTTQYIE